MERPDSLERASANRLAELCRTMPIPQLLDLLGQVFPGLPRPAAPPAAAPPAPSLDPRGTQQWRLVERDGDAYYEQPSDPVERMYWADVPRIPARAAVPRVVLIGESVARGFFHDPDFNVAIALRSALRAGRPDAPIDVVDLARTSIKPERLLALVELALRLQPAAIVVFAGNNWDPYDISVAERRQLGLQLRERGELAAVREGLAARCRTKTRGILARLGALSASSGVPMVFMLPDFNLLDWRDPTTRRIPYLPGAAPEWFRLTRRLAAALGERRYDEARDLATRVIAADGGATSIGLRALARVAIANGERAQTRDYLEQARDAVLCTPSWTSALVSPRCYGATQEAVREHGPACGLHVVDLPACFDEHYGAVPDRRVFLDHCHLTADGMRVAAAAAAGRVFSILGGAPANRQALVDWPIDVPPERLAWGHILAAAFNGAHGQAPGVVAHHCRCAIALAPEASCDVARIAALQAQPAPGGLTRTCLDLLERHEWPTLTRQAERLMFLMGNPHARRPLAWNLIAGVRAVTAGAASAPSAPPEAEDSIGRALQAGYGLDGLRTIDLLDCRLASTSPYDVESLFRETGPVIGEPLPAEPAYYAAFSPRSSFRLIVDRPRGLACSLTLRIRGAGRRRCRVRVRVRDRLVACLIVGSRWTRHRFGIGEELVTCGVNKISIEWPARSDPAGFDRAVTALIDGRVPDFSPSYGDICAFHASADE